MKELNKDQLLKILGGGDGPGDTTPAELDIMYCRAVSYSSYLWAHSTETTTIRKNMKELNKDQLQKVLGGDDGPGDDTTPVELDWSYCRAVSYSSFYWLHSIETTTIRKPMKELNKDQLLKVLGGDGPGEPEIVEAVIIHPSSRDGEFHID
jgi:hypothetical protein